MTKNKISPSSFTIVNTYTRFGTPSQNCARYGICKVLETVGGMQEGAIFDNAAYGFIQITESNKLVFKFQKNSLSQKALQKYFFDSQFLVMESLVLENDIAQLLGASKITIEAGLYHVQSNSNYLEMAVDSKIELEQGVSKSIARGVNVQALKGFQKKNCGCCSGQPSKLQMQN